MNHINMYQLKKYEAPLRFGFQEVSRSSRYFSSAEPDVGYVSFHDMQRWTIYICSNSKKMKRRNGLAFEKFRDVQDIFRAPNWISGV